MANLFNLLEFKYSHSEECPTKAALLNNLQDLLDAPRK
jgi:hypothetical protein